MSSKKLLNELHEEWLSDPNYVAEGMKLDITEEICRIMKEKNMNRSQLAERMQTSCAYITKVLRGNVNMTLLSIAKFAVALEVPVGELLMRITSRRESLVSTQ